MNNKDNVYFGKDLEAMSFAQNYHQWIFEEISPYIGQKMAEIGAGVGNFSDFLLQNDIQSIDAFEPSSNMYPYLQQKFEANSKVTTHNSFFESMADQYAEAFDSVIYINVLEHIEDDIASLVEARKTLKPGGRIIIFVPALPFLYSELDKSVGHFRRYTRGGLGHVVEQANLQIEQVKYFDIAGIIPWYIAFVLMKQTASSGNVSLYDNWVIPLMKQIEKRITPPVGKNLLLIASKAG